MRACETARPLRKRKARTVKIPLTRGQYAVIDAADAPLVRRYKWCASTHRGRRYPSARVGGRVLLLHRLLLPTLPGFEIDHKDGNPLNNRRDNLRLCTHAQNIANARPRRGSKSPFKNVIAFGNAWRVRLKKHARRYSFGVYRSEIVAACIADDARVMLWGEFAWLNFAKTIPRNFLRRFIMRSNGRIMSVTFYKRRNSRVRTMLCRVGVRKDVKGAGHAFDPKEKRLVGVYDMQNKRYRFIPEEGVLCVTYRGQRYRITPDPQQYPGAA